MLTRKRKRSGIRDRIDVERRGCRDDACARNRASTPEDLRLALRAATLYYLDGLTQAEIAARLGVSRPTAGRLVARAKAKGLVRIEVVVPPDMRDDLHAEEERELERRFGLTEAVVAGHGVDVGARTPAAFASVGRAAAALLMRRLAPDDVLGFTWGPEQVAVADGADAGRGKLPGRGATGRRHVDRRVSDRHGVHPRPLRRCVARQRRSGCPPRCTPTRRPSLSMRSDSVISRTLEAGRRADMMLFGVGAVSTSTTLFEGSFLDTRMLDELVSLGAVGEIGGRFFDADGTPVDTELQQRAVSVPLEDIRDCEKTHPDLQWRRQAPRHPRCAAGQTGQAAGL